MREILKKSTKAMEEADEAEESFKVEETTRTALTWFFWCLSKNPSVEGKIKEELRRNPAGKEVEKGQILFNLDELSKLVYLHAALSETLRLFPPVPHETRIPVEPDCFQAAIRPRIFPGKDVGFFLMKAIVATILPNYDVQVVENHPVVQNLSIALSMKYGLLARFKSISSA
ncbi:alkane hydroxylase MAH1-like [Mangifera indica]|uniref:alkane hydroxylase MAH1-like n=1 Tax=Mangifera indica TaxID=29780 RepID=UPI001CFBC425|nr:alkane hydroxylase MAH1-like [Mangifera indica]